MAATGLVAASLAAATKTQDFAVMSEALYRESNIMSQFQRLPWQGGTTFRLPIHYGGNSSPAAYAEGDDPPTAGVQAYTNAAYPEQHYHAKAVINGHAKDYALNGSPVALFWNQIAQEVARALVDLRNKVEVDMLTTSLVAPVGILGIIDDAGTLATLDRATFTWWKAVENAGAATTVAISDLDILLEDIGGTVEAGTPGKIDRWWASSKQKRILRTLGFVPGAANNSVRSMIGPSGVEVQLGVNENVMIGNAPVIQIEGLLSSVLLALETSSFGVAVCRDWTVDVLGRTGDHEDYYLTSSFGLVCFNPRHNGKITTLTA